MLLFSTFVLQNDPYNAPDGDPVEFRLTYDGLLLSATSADPRAKHKHDIRKHLHPQLKQLWELNPHLLKDDDPDLGLNEFRLSQLEGPETISRVQSLMQRFSCGEYKLVPLVTEDLQLLCEIDILFLRPDKPGSLIRSGDIDNRLKVLFDALRLPHDAKELGGHTPGTDEHPLYCLLQDDRLITKLTVNTDVLLRPLVDKISMEHNDVRLIITVRLWPTRITQGNIGYA